VESNEEEEEDCEKWQLMLLTAGDVDVLMSNWKI